jgi:pimeloyl-ACP methyl ester carboxylesterase
MATDVKRGVIRARGLEFPTLEAGDGPLVLCLHGFPDHKESFRHQLPALAAAGYRAVAPCMRGYAPSAIPADGRYQTAALAEDALAMIDALGHDDAAIIGHDWGSAAACGAAIAAPERVRALVIAALPHGPQLLQALTTNHAQQRRFWYVFFFQTPFAEPALVHDDFAFIERLWADWSPNWKAPTEAVESLKETFRQPGVPEAAIGYYRAVFDPALQDPQYATLQARMLAEPINVPTLALHGATDGCIGVEIVEGMAPLFPRGLRVEILPRAGHFLHREAPDEVNRLLLEFLRG